jgi:hypothetical protein
MLGQTFRVVPLADSPEGRASVRVLIEGKSQEIWFHAAGVQLTQSANPFLALTLLAAMATNQTLVVDGPVSPRLLQNVKHIEEIFHCWARRFQILPVVGDSVISREEPQNVACFFSGGTRLLVYPAQAPRGDHTFNPRSWFRLQLTRRRTACTGRESVTARCRADGQADRGGDN